MPLRRRRQRGAHPAPRDGRLRLARLPARHPPRPEVRLPRARPLRPAQGHRCNPNKLLLDPYAKAIDGQIDWDQSVFGYDFKTKKRNDDDSAAHMPKSVVVNPYFDWGVDRPPKTPYHKTVIYEAHVKGLTMPNPRSPRTCAAPTPASPTRRRSSTCTTSASPRSS